jgi:hypothetical protein
MVDEAKRGPGRPKKEQNHSIIEANMAETDKNTNRIVETSPVSRGLREAAIRAEELRNKMRNDQYDSQMYDEFYIDPRVIPEGWDYNWKREFVAGQSEDDHLIEMRVAGWEPVDAKRHPDMMPVGYSGPVRKKGMILMERPLEITRMAQDREAATAREVVVAKEKALGMAPAGTFERDRAKTGVRKSYQPMNIPQS